MSTPTPEAIEAAQRAMMWKKLPFGGKDATVSLDANAAHAAAQLALSAAYPLMEAQAKAEALTAFADAHRMPFTMFNHDGQRVTISNLLRAQAAEYRATIEGKDS